MKSENCGGSDQGTINQRIVLDKGMDSPSNASEDKQVPGTKDRSSAQYIIRDALHGTPDTFEIQKDWVINRNRKVHDHLFPILKESLRRK